MGSALKLVLAIGFGVAAAVMNFVYLAAMSSPPKYVAVSRSMRAGQSITADDLVAVAIPGDPERMRATLVPYARRSVLLGLPLGRPVQRGDVLLASDAAARGQRDWDVIGPFELISVGDRFQQNAGNRDPISDTGFSSVAGDTVTIAVAADLGGETRRLLQTLAADQLRTDRGDAPVQPVVAVQVLPRGESIGLNLPLDPKRGSSSPGPFVYQTVSLRGIPSVPAVLLKGDRIRFVVPKAGAET